MVGKVGSLPYLKEDRISETCATRVTALLARYGAPVVRQEDWSRKVFVDENRENRTC